jgi:hypothetical protein
MSGNQRPCIRPVNSDLPLHTKRSQRQLLRERGSSISSEPQPFACSWPGSPDHEVAIWTRIWTRTRATKHHLRPACALITPTQDACFQPEPACQNRRHPLRDRCLASVGTAADVPARVRYPRAGIGETCVMGRPGSSQRLPRPFFLFSPMAIITSKISSQPQPTRAYWTARRYGILAAQVYYTAFERQQARS